MTKMSINKILPARLTNNHYIKTGLLRILQQVVDSPVEVHWHEFYELSFIVAGKGSHTFNGVIYELGRGSIFLLTPADFHGLAPLPGTSLEIHNIIFSEELLEEELRHLLFDNARLYRTSFAAAEFIKVAEWFSRISAEIESEQLGQKLAVRSALTNILVELARKCSTPGPSQEQSSIDSAHPAIHKAITYIQHHFREEISQQDLARLVQLNPNYFSECFKETTGSSFQRYVINLRLDFAASPLRITQLPITEICYASGFNTLSHFERLFKQKFNRTPHSYRNNSNRPDSEAGNKKGSWL